MTSAVISRSIIIVFGLLYPAYNSYKAIKTRNVTQYVKCMMYWIVFALFYNVETISDLLISWLPMYYELKAIFVIWLLSPVTQGAEVLYSLYIHPQLLQHEQEIEETIAKVKSQSYSTILNLGAQGMNMALQGAIVGQSKLAEQLRRAYSLEDLDSQRHQSLLITELPPDFDNAVMTRSMQGDLTAARYQPQTPVRHRHSSSELKHSHGVHGRSGREETITNKYVSVDQTDRATGHPQRRLERPVSMPSPPTQSHLMRSTSMKTSFTDRSSRSSTSVKRSSSQSTESPHNTQTKPHSAQTKSHTTQAKSHSTQTKSKANIAKPIKRPPLTSVTNMSDNSVLTPDAGATTSKTKSRWSESTLRYRTKKISDIKHQKITSPFVSMW